MIPDLDSKNRPTTPRGRILMIGNFLSGANGSRGVCEDLAERLRDRGWDVWWASRRPGKIARLLDMTKTTLRASRCCSVAQIDVFSGPAFLWAEWVGRLLCLRRVPFVLSLHGGNLPNFARAWPRRVQRLLNAAAAVTTPSGYLKTELAWLREDLELLPNPIEISRYPYRCRDNPSARLVWLRALHRIYDPCMAVKVFEMIRAEFPDAVLKMVGPDKGDGSGEELRAELARVASNNDAEWVGPVVKDKVGEHLDFGDVFLNTTTIDNSPVSVLEAMACGLCVVSTSVGGIPHLIEHEKEGLLTRQGDVEQMVDAVRRLVREPGLGCRLSRGARTKAMTRDWTIVLPKWEQVLHAASRGLLPSPVDAQ